MPRGTPGDLMRLLLVCLALRATGARADAPATRPTRVAVLSLSADKGSVIARELRQALIDSLARNPAVVVTAIDAEAADVSEATRKAKADLIVFGSVRQEGIDVRLSGFVIDGGSGRVAASLLATGTVPNRFDLEDVVCDQAARSMPRPPTVAVATTRRPGEASASGPLVDPAGAHTPWDHAWVDTDATDSINNLRYGDLDLLSGYGGVGGLAAFGGGGSALGFAWGGGFGATFNTGSGGLPR